MKEATSTIFVCCHKRIEVPHTSLLHPIQVGAALADDRFPGFLSDDVGKSISTKNRSYCELTAQYWAWKNFRAEHYGFFHYRRFLYPDQKEKRPYRIEGEPAQEVLHKLRFEDFPKLIDGSDMIMPIGEDMHITVRNHYENAPYHYGSDLELTEQILREMHPECVGAMEEYLAGTVLYFGNIYIMRRDVFNDYCAWLFPILEEFDRRADVSGYNTQEMRVDGFLAERLLGVYYFWRRGELKTLELPRVHFEPDTGKRIREKAVNLLLPPGTVRRAYIKRLYRGK